MRRAAPARRPRGVRSGTSASRAGRPPCSPSDDVRERCAGWGQTADGRITSPARSPQRRHHAWTISAPSGAYRGARGTIVARDLGDRESLLTITITPRAGVVLHSGVLERPAADHGFRRRADPLCASAARQLAALPPFPFSTFDPLHPDPVLLPSSAGSSPDPTTRGPPFARSRHACAASVRPRPTPTRGGGCSSARAAALAVDDEQDRAALAADSPAVHQERPRRRASFRAVAVASTVFGVSRCVL